MSNQFTHTIFESFEREIIERFLDDFFLEYLSKVFFLNFDPRFLNKSTTLTVIFFYPPLNFTQLKFQ